MSQFSTANNPLKQTARFNTATLLTTIISMLFFETLQLLFFPQWTGIVAGFSTVLFSSAIALIASARLRKKKQRETEPRFSPTSSDPDRIEADQNLLYQTVLDTDPSLIYVKDQNGIYRIANQALARFFGTSSSQIIGRSDLEFLPDDEIARKRMAQDQRILETCSGKDTTSSEERITDTEGKQHWFSVTRRCAALPQSEAPVVIGIAQDICKLKLSETRLAYERAHDPLTGLPNLESFKAILEEKYRQPSQPDALYALLMLDVDNFRRVNESHGYALGDRLMVAVSKRLAACIRSSDIMIRLKGDEFALLVQDLNNRDEVNPVIERVFEKIQRPFTIDGLEFCLSTSIGIVFGNGFKRSSEEILRDAEIAMSLAKSGGKSNFVIFDENMRTLQANRVSLEADFRKAIEQNELRLHYQPIKSLETGQVTIIEALVRWQHPRRGLIYPNDFIHLAEESDWIIQIGEWVLRKACRQTRVWQDRFPHHHPLTVSVNISSKQLLQDRFILLVESILEETGLDAHHLKMEITESIFLGKSEQVIQVLTQLNEIGVQLYIDDFGTGYSSLSYLSQIPFDAIKIDRSFVDGLVSRDGDMKIVEAIVRLASDLGKDLVAEGVETVEQRDWLQKLGCKYEQGYLFSRPVEADAIEKFFNPKQV